MAALGSRMLRTLQPLLNRTIRKMCALKPTCTCVCVGWGGTGKSAVWSFDGPSMHILMCGMNDQRTVLGRFS